jgi:predicted DCC family thiol-disulfide oxidoreductase YuxK
MNRRDAKSSGPLILFDGFCGLCDASVQFIIDHDPNGRFHFAPLQSETGRRLLAQYHLDPETLNAVVLIDDTGAHIRSAAVIRICMLLGKEFSLVGEFLAMIPQPLRDAMYDWIARNRYRWFGKRDACRVPTPHLAARFLS